MASCQKPEYINPTAERQGITSLTAYFTSGKFIDQQLGKLTVTDPEAERFEIPIPWFYPEESNDQTLTQMTRVRLRAELANNCSISPALTIVDLLQENHYTFTNAQGQSRDIIITGKRIKSSKADMMSMTLAGPAPIEGFIDNDNHEVYLFTIEDINGRKAQITTSAHASVKGGQAVEGKNNTFELPVADYNSIQKITLIAHDGSEIEYTITKKIPSKIPSGFNESSAKKLFNIEPVSRFGAPDYTSQVHLSIAAANGKLAVCYGSERPVIYLDGQTGEKLGEVITGDAVADAITNDEAGNILFINHLKTTGTFKIYRSKDMSKTPELLFSVSNTENLPAGYHIKVTGNVDKNAIIVITHEGVEGATYAGSYISIAIEGGKVKSSKTTNLIPLGIQWGTAPVHAAKVIPTTENNTDAVMLCYYSDNKITYVENQKIVAKTEEMTANSNFNTNCMDSKTFNNAIYAAHLVTSHFPMWGCGPQLFIYDITTPESIKEMKPAFLDNTIEWHQKAASGCAAGDVTMAISADGFKLFIYYYDHNCGVVGAYSVDCVKK